MAVQNDPLVGYLSAQAITVQAIDNTAAFN